MRYAFTLIELLVVIAIVSILASMLFPVFARAKEAGKKASCLSNLRQIGIAFQMYESDYDDRLPDRRDLKSSLPGGYRPWTSWPPSDPRAGWAAVLLDPYVKLSSAWACPGILGTPVGQAVQVLQQTSVDGPSTNCWLWRFDRPTLQIDEFWGKTEDEALLDLQKDNDPKIGYPHSVSDIELAVDPYFPKTIGTVPQALKGKTAHFNGRNRVMLDSHAKFLPDARTNG